ncbi:MAG: hemerythrin domain-containing protein [Gaiellaceae bacterium]
MPVVSEDFRTAHASISVQTEALRRAARDIPHMAYADRAAARDAVVDFLRRDVEPHTRLDERLLYPEVAERLGAPLATASMAYDHLAIRQWIADLEDADPADPDRIPELLYGLDALMRVHIWKENALYLPVVEASGWPVDVRP